MDNVNHPNHYTAGGIETFGYIKDKLSKEQLQGYLTGNIIKYVSRYQFKNGIEDIKKAQRYMRRLGKWLKIIEGIKFITNVKMICEQNKMTV